MGQEIGWERVHRRLCRLARHKGRYDLEEMRWMRRAKQMRVHRRLGYGSFHEYIEHLFGYSPRFTYEKLRVADALDELPALREALREAKHSYSAVRELSRVATPETERQWLEAAEGKRVRDIEKMVSGHDKGDRPGSEKKERLRRHRLVYDVSSETKSVVQLARDKLTKQLGRSVTDDELLQHLARRELEGEGGRGDGRQSPNRIHYEVCPKCDDGAQVAGGEAEPVDDATVQRVKCDAKASGAHVGNGKRARQRPSPAQREAKMREQRFGCAVPGCTNRVWLEDHHEDLVSEGGTDDPKRRVVLCWAHHDARHRGQLLIEGDAEQGWRFFHADGTPYGQTPDPDKADVFRIAREVLCKMGFKDREAKQAIADCRAHAGTRPTVEEVVAAALRAVPDPRGTKRYGPPSRPTPAARESLAPYQALGAAA
ncbi:MAG: HNH endonuclease signature motif containing protein [Polyangiales bacterium]